MLRHMSYNPVIMGNSTYVSKYNTILAFMEKNIWEKWRSRTSNGIYYDTVHVLSHWILINMAIAELSTSSANRAIAQTFVNEATYIGMGSYAGSAQGHHLRGMMIINPAHPTAYYFSWTTVNYSARADDCGHGSAVLNCIAEQYDKRYVWTAADMDKFAGMVRDVILADTSSPYTYPYYIDGSTGSTAGDGWIPDGGNTMGRYSISCQQRLENHRVGSLSTIYGCGCLAAAYLFGTQQP
jgi:hypothetical protein